MTLPTRRLVILLAATLPVALLPAIVDERLWPLWAALVAGLALACLADALLAVPRGRLRVDAQLPTLLYIGDVGVVTLTVRTEGWRHPAAVAGFLEVDDDLGEPAPFRAELAPEQETAVPVEIRPRRRGAHHVSGAWLRWDGPLGLIERTLHVRLDEPVRVVPNIAAVQRAALRFFSNREFLAGLKVERYAGEGSEFDALREFVPGYDPRAIDWKASARHTKLLCRDFRAERNHPVVLAFDTGHLMSEPLDGIPKLDHAINAGLLLAYVALRTGDRVGLYAFDEKVRPFPAPLGGVGAMRRVQELSTGLDYSTTETNFTLGLTSLLTRLTRRSLVILFTDFVDSVTAELMLENVGRLGRRHLVLFVALRDASLDAVERGPPDSVRDLARAVVAGDLVRERETVLRRLARKGVLTLDTPPAGLTTGLINRYLDVKRRELVA